MNAGYNSVSTFAVAEGVDFANNRVRVVGSAHARADFGAIYSYAHGSSAGKGFGRPAAYSAGQAGGMLTMDWTITGPSGVFGTIYVGGGTETLDLGLRPRMGRQLLAHRLQCVQLLIRRIGSKGDLGRPDRSGKPARSQACLSEAS